MACPFLNFVRIRKGSNFDLNACFMATYFALGWKFIRKTKKKGKNNFRWAHLHFPTFAMGLVHALKEHSAG